MMDNTEHTQANRLYATAYDTHYSQHDLPAAMRLYTQIMASHPGDPEADYSRMQIQNIIKAVVPKETLLDAQMDLALAHFERSA